MVTMYFSDPDRGRRRRALVRDQLYHWTREFICATEVAWRDLGNRMKGMGARARKAVRHTGPTPDSVVEERVRARLGRATSHPRAIKVQSQQGWVNLSGAVLADEKEDVLDTVKGTAGVVAVADNMQTYDSAAHIPSLQGNHELQRARSRLALEKWTPTTRAAAAVGGCALGCTGLVRRSPFGIALAVAGFGLMAAGTLVNPRAPRRRPHRAPHRRPAETTPQAAPTREGEPAHMQVESSPATQPAAPQAGTILH
jgi:hypothetical protein